MNRRMMIELMKTGIPSGGLYKDSTYLIYEKLPAGTSYAGQDATWTNIKLAYPQAFQGTSIVGNSGSLSSYFPRNFTGHLLISDEINYIGDYAFTTCSQLKSVKMQNSITRIGANVFSHCTNLQNIKFSNILNSMGNRCFYGCEHLDNIIIPDSVVNVGEEMFSYCTNLQNIQLSNKLVNLPAGIFGNCTSLTTIILPNSIKTLGELAFATCSNLGNVTMPNALEDIGGGCFAECRMLISISIYDTVKHIGRGAFSACSSLSNAYFEDVEKWYIGNSQGAQDVLLSAFSLLDTAVAATYLRSNYTSKYWTNINQIIAPGCYSDSNYRTFLRLRNGRPATWENLKEAYPAAFTTIGALKEGLLVDLLKYTGASGTQGYLVVPKEIHIIGNVAFQGYNGLRGIVLSHSLDAIGVGAFDTCSYLQQVEIPIRVTKIGYSSFYYTGYALTNSAIRFKPPVPPVNQGSASWAQGLPTTCVIYVPNSSLQAYRTAVNYPNPNTYRYIGYNI